VVVTIESLLHGSGGWRAGLAGVGARSSNDPGSPMPFKANAARRHRIPKQRRRITNWAEYDAALRQRGSLTLWFTNEAIAAWHAEPRTTPGGQPHYSALAITTALTLKAVFRLALRQTEGLIGSIIITRPKLRIVWMSWAGMRPSVT
jgi:Transposase DDE domain